MGDNLNKILLRELTRNNDAPVFYDNKHCYKNGILRRAISWVQEKFIEKGVKRGDTVMVLADKSCISVTTFITCILSGVTVVPLDKKTPSSRLEYIISQCNPTLVCTEEKTYRKNESLFVRCGIKYIDISGVEQALEEGRDFSIEHVENIEDDAIAYIIFTSGSTGRPKGVAISRHAFNHFIEATLSHNIYSKDTFLLSMSPFYVDACIFDVFIPWLSGARVYLYNKFLFINDVIKKLQNYEITDISCNPIIISLLARERKLLEMYTWEKFHGIFYGGESVDVQAVRTMWDIMPKIHFYNGYGPTETVVICSCHELSCDDVEYGVIPIGLPLEGIGFYLKEEVDGEANEGELLVSGEQMLAYYCGNQKNDIFETINGIKYYCTGDIVEFKRGNYYLRGRKSKMIKLRGFRIFPLEIENVLKLVDGIGEAVVIKHKKEEKLIAIIETQMKEHSLLLEKVKEKVKNYLPLYMIPEEFHFVEQIERMDSGKVDYALLTNQFGG